MASTLARLTDFVPATPILSSEVDAEFNQLVNFLNGTSVSVKATLDVNDSGDPPLELNQLGTGPILKGFQAGVENFRIRNDGSLRTPGIYDTNDNQQLLFSLTASAVNEFTMKNAAAGNPPELRVTGGDGNIGLKLVPKGTGVVKIQSGDPVAAEDAAHKSYVDARRTRWSASFFIADIAARGVDVNFDSVQGALVPGSNFVATHVAVKANSGTNTGTFTIQLGKVPAGNLSITALDSVSWNPGGGSTLGTAQEVALGSPHAFTANDYIIATITAVSSPLQKSVWCTVRGYQTPQNP